MSESHKDSEGVSESQEEEFFSSEVRPEEPAPEEDVVQHHGPRLRSPTLMVLVVGLAVWLMLDFRDDLAYFLSAREPIEMGDAADVGREPPDLPDNRLARVTGIPLVTRVSKSRVWGVARNYFPLMGSQNRVFVSVVREEDPEDPERKSGVIVERPFAGRLRDMHHPDYDVLREYYIEQFGTKFPERCYLLIDGSQPGDKYPYAILYVFLGILVLFNAFIMVRYFLLARPGKGARA